MAYELLYPLQVVRSELFNIVVACTVHIVWWIFMLCGIVKFTSVIEWNYLVSSSMYDEHWAIDVWHSVDVWELIKGQCPAKVEDDTESGHKW